MRKNNSQRRRGTDQRKKRFTGEHRNERTRRSAVTIRALLIGCLTVLFAAFPPAGHADFISGTGGTSGLASFTGDFTYNQGTSQLVISLTNSTPAGGGFLTAFAFNNPSDLITAASLSSTLSSFSTLLGGTTFQDGIAAPPFGDFDIGASTNSSWLGGGSPSGGIGVSSSATFTFGLTCGGSGCGPSLATSDFLSALSSNPQGGGAQFFVARFRGLSIGEEGSDKVPGTPIPEPGTLLLIGTGLVGIGIGARRRRK